MADSEKLKRSSLISLLIDLCGIAIKKIARRIRARREKKSQE